MTEYAVTDPATGEQIRTLPDRVRRRHRGGPRRGEPRRTRAGRGPRRWPNGRPWSAGSAELHVERRDELAAIINREMGKPIDASLGEVDFCADIYGFYADHAEELLADQPVPHLAGAGSAVIRRSAFGVLLGIMPWNYPYYQVARFAAPNLVTGNPILLKHAPQCPESAAALQQIFLDAGFPEGAYINIYATNDQVADIIADPRVAGVSLTGSERAGAAVAEIAGRHLKKVVLELGGSDPFILLATDDLDAAVDAAVEARMENTGQACNAGKRFIVAEPIYDDFVDEVHRTDAGQGGRAVAAVLVAGGREPGGPGRTGGRRRCDLGQQRARSGAHFPPGVLTGVRTDQPASSARSCSARWPWCSRPARRTRRSTWPTTPRSVWGRTCSPATPIRPPGSPTGSRPAWSSSTASGSRPPSCRSAA